MEKYLVSEIPQHQQVVIDVPEGYLRVAGYVNEDTGDGRMVFSRATKFADVGSAAVSESESVPLLHLHVQTPERARAIARAFMQLADNLQDWEDAAEMSDACEECNCDDCPQHDFCYSDDEEDDNG